MLHRDMECLSDRRRHVLGPRWLRTPFHVGLRKLLGILGKEIGAKPKQAACLLPGRDNHRRLVSKRREEVSKSMAEPRCRMQIDKGGTTRCLRIAVGHADHAAFLKPENVVDVLGPIVQEGELR